MTHNETINAGTGCLRNAFRLSGFLCLLAAPAFLAGCRAAEPAMRAVIIDNNPASDPANANLAAAPIQPAQIASPRPAAGKIRVLAAQQSFTPRQSSEQYSPQQQYSLPAPSAPQYQIPQAQNQQYSDQQNQIQPNQPYGNDQPYSNQDPTIDAGYEALADASQPPPPLPDYEQPPLPEQNDLWTPGYWNYAQQGYFWVPGAWIAPPYAGALWTPAYWGYDGGHYRLHRGFWARHIGFYGGVNYGYGYTGSGYHGGYWNGNDFYYNRAVNRVNVANIRNVYEHNVVVNNVTRVSYNGGNGGLRVRPGPQELAVYREQRTPPMAAQVQLRQASEQNRQQFFNENHGRPAQPFVTRPLGAERTEQPFNQQNQAPNQQFQRDQQREIGQQRQAADQQVQQQRLQNQQVQQQVQNQQSERQNLQQQRVQDQQLQQQRAQQQQSRDEQGRQQRVQQQQFEQQRAQDQQLQQQQRVQQQHLQDQQVQQQQQRQDQQQLQNRHVRDQTNMSPRLQQQQHPEPTPGQQQPGAQPQTSVPQRNAPSEQRGFQQPQRSMQAQPAPRSLTPNDHPGTVPSLQPRTMPQPTPQSQPESGRGKRTGADAPGNNGPRGHDNQQTPNGRVTANRPN